MQKSIYFFTFRMLCVVADFAIDYYRLKLVGLFCENGNFFQ